MNSIEQPKGHPRGLYVLFVTEMWERFSYYGMRALFALFMGIVTLLDEGLELAMGIHFANNMMASIMVCSDHSVIKTYSIFK